MAATSKSRPISLSMKGDVGGLMNSLESPPDSNGGFFSPLLDLKPTSMKPPTSESNNTPSGSSENSNSGDVYCICRRTASNETEENDDDVMIECDSCKDWLHGR